MPPKKASKRRKPLKILIYGASGVGKTHFALHATPGKTLVFDMEGGTDLFEGRVEFDYWTDDEGYKTQSYRELRKCIDYLKSPEGREGYKTFVIDPVTLIWTLLQQERQDYKESRVKTEKANETDLETFTTRDWNIVKKMHKAVIDELSALGQNVVLIAREKPVVIMKNGEPVNTGEFTFDAEKNTIYAVDFAFRIWADKKGRFAQIEKDRSGTYNKGQVINEPTFELFDSIVNSMADGDEVVGLKTESEDLFNEPKKLEEKTLRKLQKIREDLGKSDDDFLKGLSDYLKLELAEMNDLAKLPKAKLENLIVVLSKRAEEKKKEPVGA